MPIPRKVAAVLFLAFAAPLAAHGQPAMMSKPVQPALTVDYTVDPSAPYTPGETLTVQFTVSNPGPATAEDILIQTTAANLVEQPLQGPCQGQPCSIPYLREGQKAVFRLTSFIARDGRFSATLSATPRGTGIKPFAATFTAITTPQPAPAAKPPSGAAKVPADQPAPPAPLPPGVPPPEVLSSKPDVGVTGQLKPEGPYRPGQLIDLLLQVTNRGRVNAPEVIVTGTLDNLTLKKGSGCSAKPCSFANLAPGASRPITLAVVIGTAGSFAYTARIVTPVPASLPEGGEVRLSAFADPPPPPPTSPWIWPIAALGAMALVGALIALAVAQRRAWWRSRIAVAARCDPAASVAVSGPLSFARLPMHLQAELAPPTLLAPTHLPILRKEIQRD